VLESGYADELVRLGRAEGLDAVGVAPAAPFERARGELERRKAAGLHGDMAFTFKNPARSTDPERSVRGARAIVVGARTYAMAPPSTPVRHPGRVARYAWVDHYAPLRAALGVVARRLRADGWKAVVLADDNSLVDREAAWLAGLGWYGKNANLLLPGRGSWYVLGGVVTNAPLATATRPVDDGCGRCRRCIDGCPTEAIVAPGVVDARRCLAWLVQAPGIFPAEHRVALADRIYGCDDCQEVCPPNRGTGSDQAPDSATATVDLVELLEMSDSELLDRYGRWYLADRDPDQLRRNALIALGNSAGGADADIERVLRAALMCARPLLGAHAVWAAARLGRTDLLGAVADDRDPWVRDELARVPVVALPMAERKA
jgi:epoxyqueuosine reductase